MEKKITLHSELMFVFASFMLAMAVACSAAANFGVSMIAAPTLILNAKFQFLTVGQWEYVLQAIVLTVYCLCMRRFRIVFLQSFLTGFLYGLFLDIIRKVIPILNPEITEPGSMALPIRILFFVIGILLTSIAVALFFHLYLHPMVYDFILKDFVKQKNLKIGLCKTIYDLIFLIVSITLSLVFFGELRCVHIGTVIITCVNGTLISQFRKLIQKTCTFKPLFSKLFAYYNK